MYWTGRQTDEQVDERSAFEYYDVLLPTSARVSSVLLFNWQTDWFLKELTWIHLRSEHKTGCEYARGKVFFKANTAFESADMANQHHSCCLSYCTRFWNADFISLLTTEKFSQWGVSFLAVDTRLALSVGGSVHPSINLSIDHILNYLCFHLYCHVIGHFKVWWCCRSVSMWNRIKI